MKNIHCYDNILFLVKYHVVMETFVMNVEGGAIKDVITSSHVYYVIIRATRTLLQH